MISYFKRLCEWSRSCVKLGKTLGERLSERMGERLIERFGEMFCKKELQVYFSKLPEGFKRA